MCDTTGHCANLSDSEKESIDYVVEKLRPYSVSQIIEASHEETGWLACSVAHSHIAYDEAFDLKLL